MSIQQRRAIMYWFTLIFGIAILCLQFYKYFTGTLELKIEEGIVSVCAVALMRNPNIISDGLKSFINSKTNEKNES
jgi:hypothetical protein